MRNYLAKRTTRAFLLIIIAGILRAQSSLASGLIKAEGHSFKDAQGRCVLLRGVDLSNSAKVPPFNPLPRLSLLPKMREWGINNIRLAFIWEAFEPEAGHYNFAYLDMLAQIVDAAGKVGITSIIDFHSDAFSRYSVGGCGSGFPKWAIPPNVAPWIPSTVPLCSIWPATSAAESLFPESGYHQTVEAFYNNTYGARTRFLEAWIQIARYFRNNKNIIAYDILNEPWGNEKSQLAPLYEDTTRAIRSEDPDVILMIEPYLLVGLGDHTHLPAPSFSNFAYAPHDYDIFALGFRTWIQGDRLVDSTLKSIQKTAAKFDAPIYIGEYGASGTGVGIKGLTQHYYSLFDQHFISGGQWDLADWNPETKDGWNFEDMSFVGSNENLRKNFIVRPFPMTVAGEPGEIKESFPKDLSQGKTLNFSWKNQPELGTTVFFIPKNTLGGKNFKVTFTSSDPTLTCTFDSTSFLLSCESPTNGLINIHIAIHPSSN